MEIKKGTSWAQKVNDIAPLLGLNTPQYILNAVNANAPNILSGYVCFPGSSGGLGEDARVGEVRNVFGKKNAKEEVARGAWEVLLDLAQQRGLKFEEE